MNPSEDSNTASTPAPAPQPAAESAPVPGTAQPAAATPAAPGQENPGKTLGVISLVASLFNFGVISLIIGIIGLKKSKKAGMSNGFAVAGIVISIIGIVITIFAGTVLLLGGAALVQKCQQLGPGTHYENGTTYTCS